MSKKNITAIVLYLFVLVVGISVVLFIDKNAKDQMGDRLSETQAVNIARAYNPELKVYQLSSVNLIGSDWLVTFTNKTETRCVRVKTDGTVYPTCQ